MTAFLEPLPGLLDDPLLHLPDLPPRTDVRIPPLRDPFPSRALTVLSPLEPNAPDGKQIQGGVKLGSSKNPSQAERTTPKITPADVISARDTKKPNLAISALVESSSTSQLPRLLTPSFVNLAAVENNSSFQSWPAEYSPSKRVKLDHEYHGDYVQLPKPQQKEASKRVPLLPTIVNGIHEPPPSAALLPPMELEEVKAMLDSISEPLSLPPEKMLNPEPEPADIVNHNKFKPSSPTEEMDMARNISTAVNNRPQRTWKKWSEEETQQLLKGVAKHGAGKWKEICADPELRFRDRRPMDLKDRFRICFPNTNKEKMEDVGPTARLDKQLTFNPGHTRNNNISHNLPSSTDTLSSPPSDLSPNQPSSSHFYQSPNMPLNLKVTPSDFAIAAKSRASQRVRKLWTEEEHQNLVKGFAKHGYQWTAIRNDLELNLSHRKATDIRDKFRSLFPQQYMDADSGPPAGRKNTTSAGGVSSKNNSMSSISQPTTSVRHINSLNPTSDKRKPSTSFAPIPMSATTTKSLHLRADEGPRDITTSGVEALEITTITTTTTQESSSTVPNLTLPPLALGDNDWDWGDNKLAPLLDWEEFGL